MYSRKIECSAFDKEPTGNQDHGAVGMIGFVNFLCNILTYYTIRGVPTITEYIRISLLGAQLSSCTFGCVSMSDFLPNNRNLQEIIFIFLPSKVA